MPKGSKMPGKAQLEEFYKINEGLIASGLITGDALEGQTYDEIQVPTEWQTFLSLRLTPELNRLYAFAIQDENPWYQTASPFGGPIAHPITLVQLGAPPVIRQFPVTVPPGQSSLHAKMECEFLRPARVGATFKVQGRLSEKYVRRGRRYLVTEGRYVDEATGEVVLQYHHVRMVGKEG